MEPWNWWCCHQSRAPGLPFTAVQIVSSNFSESHHQFSPCTEHKAPYWVNSGLWLRSIPSLRKFLPISPTPSKPPTMRALQVGLGSDTHVHILIERIGVGDEWAGRSTTGNALRGKESLPLYNLRCRYFAECAEYGSTLREGFLYAIINDERST